jgi:cyclopropane fatty-acyl-phospholipid synthase-like methyltransferase
MLQRRPNRHTEHYAKWIEANPNDLWGQTGSYRRDVPGEDSAETLVATLIGQLELQPDDVLLDLGCGNGALTNMMFDRCAGGLGIDGTEAFIKTAKSRFETNTRRFIHQDMLSGLVEAVAPERLTKALCNGAFQYLWPEDATAVLAQLSERFENIDRIVLGSLPDRDKLPSLLDYIDPAMFPHGIPEGFEDDAESMFGVWRTKDETIRLGIETNWSVEIAPVRGLQGRYRFNAVLTRV